MATQMAYGSDVSWDAHEIAAFRLYNQMCREQAIAIHAANVAGRTPPASTPAKVFADRARAIAKVAA